jgi:uncharacterized damage-inducible protein DinB
MLDYFKRLFQYNAWAQERILAALEKIDPAKLDEKAVKIAGHILLASRIWLNRLTGKPNIDLSQALSLAQGRALFEELKPEWKTYLDSLSENSLSEKAAYQTKEGKTYENGISDVLAHLVNHSTYHRGQIATLIKKSGGEVPYTDFIAFVRVEGQS